MGPRVALPATLVWLTLLWIALWGSLSWANVLGGLAVALAVALVARTGGRTLRTKYFRPHWAVWYVLVVAYKLVESNLRLAWEILTPGIGTHTSIIAVPMRGGSDAVVTLVANSITLTPGTMTVDVVRGADPAHHDVPGAGSADGDPGHTAGDRIGVTLYVHGMYTRDVEAVRHEILELEAVALRAFGSADDYLHAEADVEAHLPLIVDAGSSERAQRRSRRRIGVGRMAERDLVAVDPQRAPGADATDSSDDDRSRPSGTDAEEPG